jgi:hypothetical protein
MIKKWLKICFWILIMGGVITVFVFAKKEESKKVVESPAISIHVDGETFLTEEELTVRLKNAGLLRKKMKH